MTPSEEQNQTNITTTPASLNSIQTERAAAEFASLKKSSVGAPSGEPRIGLQSASDALAHAKMEPSMVLAPDDRKLYEILIRYEPYAAAVKWIKYRFSAWSSFKAWFALSLVVIFFAFGGPNLIVEGITTLLDSGLAKPSARDAATIASAADANFAIYSGLFWFLCLVGLGGFAVYLANPTDVRFDKNGISLEWNRLNLKIKKSLSWQNVEKIEVFYPSGKTAQQDCIIRFKDVSKTRDIDLKFGAFQQLKNVTNCSAPLIPGAMKLAVTHICLRCCHPHRTIATQSCGCKRFQHHLSASD
jgi:hypothetical protein